MKNVRHGKVSAVVHHVDFCRYRGSKRAFHGTSQSSFGIECCNEYCGLGRRGHRRPRKVASRTLQAGTQFKQIQPDPLRASRNGLVSVVLNSEQLSRLLKMILLEKCPWI